MPKFGDVDFCPYLNATGIRTALLGTACITGAKVAAGTLTTAKIANYGITASKLATGAVATVKLAANAVSTAKIANFKVTASKLATGAVATVKLAAGGVTNSKVANGTLTNAKIANGTITNAKIANGIISLGGAADGSSLGKLNAKVQRFTTAGSNAIVSVPHGLGRTPVGWIVIWKNKTADLIAGTTAWAGATNLRVQANQATVGFAIVVL